MSIIMVEVPSQASGSGTRQRFSVEDAQQAEQALLAGKGASDGEIYKSDKAAQQAAWELRHAIAGLHLEDSTREERSAWLKSAGYTSKAVEGEDKQWMFLVYKR